MHYFKISSLVEVKSILNLKGILDATKILEWTSEHYAFTTLLLLPITTLGTYWAFKKEPYNFIQHLVINSFLSGLHIVIRLFFFPLLFLVDKKNGMSILSIPDAIGIIFTMWTLYQFFDYIPKNKRIWKIVLSYIYLGLLFGTIVLSIGVIVGFIFSS